MAKHFNNEGLIGYNSKDKIKIPISQTGEMSTETRHVFQIIMNNADFKTMDDSIQGNRLANAIDKAEGKDEIAIEDGVHDWLKRKAEQVCPTLFRVNGSIVYEFIKEGFNKPHQPKGKEKGKEAKDALPTKEGGEQEEKQHSEE